MKNKNNGKIFKNIIRGIRRGIKAIVKFFDKYIIFPITKLIVWVVDRTGDNGKKIEKVLVKTNVLIILSLVVSLGMFFVVDNRANTFVESSAEILYNKPVKSIYNEESYIVEGIPETVDVTLIGRSSDLYLAKQLPIHEIALDLTGLKPGTHKVTLKYKQSVTSIDYKLDPSSATVVIYTKESEVRSLTVDVLNKEDLDSKLVIEKADIDRDDVIIKGAAHTLERVATVKALLDINNIIDPNVGDEVLTNIPLIAYDESGNMVDCEIVPSKVSATITISSPQKQVPVKIVPVGEVSFGRAIDSIFSDETTVVIYGDQSTIDDITFIPIEVDVEGLKTDKEYNVSIEKPMGINSMSVLNATVNIVLDDEVSKEITGITLRTQGLQSGLSVTAVTQSDTQVDIVVNGTQGVLDALDLTTINAYIDLSGYGVGEHEIDVVVSGEDLRVEYVPKVKKVTVKITNSN